MSGQMESSERILEGTSGHSQGPEMWMALDFIVSNCTSELSLSFSYLFLYCRKSYLSAVCYLRKGSEHSLSFPGQKLKGGYIHPFMHLPGDWIFPYQRIFSPLDFFLLFLAFVSLKLKSDVF